MKRNLVIFGLAVLVGSLFAVYIFSGIDKTMAKSIYDNTISLFQIGAYNEYENALSISQVYPNSIIIKENNYYKVFIALAHDKELVEKYEQYYQKKNINYYLKKANVSSECLEKINKYEQIILQSTNLKEYDKINKSILSFYKGECND